MSRAIGFDARPGETRAPAVAEAEAAADAEVELDGGWLCIVPAGQFEHW